MARLHEGRAVGPIRCDPAVAFRSAVQANASLPRASPAGSGCPPHSAWTIESRLPVSETYRACGSGPIGRSSAVRSVRATALECCEAHGKDACRMNQPPDDRAVPIEFVSLLPE